jgi:hypothetical protein
MHMHWLELLSAGLLAINTVGEPGTHGAVVFGIHGIGVNTPSAAAVADATVGLAMDMHIPNGGMFSRGFMSMMVAAGILLHITLFAGNTVNVPGAIPNVHIIIAPDVTS